jgi:putative ATP-binding cassette transporter
MSFLNKLASLASLARKVWALSLPYFKSEEKWKARLLLALIIALNLAAVYMLVLLNDWNRLFYDSLQNKDQPVFWRELGRFTYLAFAYIIIAVYRFYLTQLIEIRWRAWMTRQYTQRWLGAQAFYKLELARYSGGAGQPPDNPDQRIHEDLNLFTAQSVSLSMGLLNAVVTLVSFVGILWGLSGAFGFTLGGQEWSIPGFMVWMAVLYCLVGSFAAHYIGRRLIPLNFQQQRFEADFRHHLVRVREYSESIALDRGEQVERSALDLRFGSVLGNYLRLLKAQKDLTWFTVGFAQAAVVFPFIVAAPRFFSGAIQLGELMQIASAFGRVQDSMSWFVDNYSSLASWRATTDRLTSFDESLRANSLPNLALQTQEARDLTADGLTLALPGGKLLVSQASLNVQNGDAVLVQGPSGSGKSTLFRAIAGIWPFASGKLARPGDIMFVPQRSYFPNGRLRDALAYPQAASGHSDEQLRQALDQAELPQLKDRLDDEDAWSQKLSGGEQQRLALARVFLKSPQWVLADESTSALDDKTEASLYQRLLDMVRKNGGALVSIAHRPGPAAFHNRRWEFAPSSSGAAAFEITQHAAPQPANAAA